MQGNKDKVEEAEQLLAEIEEEKSVVNITPKNSTKALEYNKFKSIKKKKIKIVEG